MTCTNCKCQNLVERAIAQRVPLFNHYKGTSDACLHCRFFCRYPGQLEDCRAEHKGTICCCSCHDGQRNNCFLADYKLCFDCIDSYHSFSGVRLDKRFDNCCSCTCHSPDDYKSERELSVKDYKLYAIIAGATIFISAAIVCAFGRRS